MIILEHITMKIIRLVVAQIVAVQQVEGINFEVEIGNFTNFKKTKNENQRIQ